MALILYVRPWRRWRGTGAADRRPHGQPAASVTAHATAKGTTILMKFDAAIVARERNAEAK